MDLSSLRFAAVLIGGLALCYFIMKVRFRQISYECELVLELSAEFLSQRSPAVGDAVYYFFQMSNARRSPLGTTHTMQSSSTAWALGSTLHAQSILGVISAIDGAYIYVETFGFEGKGVWHVVDSKGNATAVARVNSILNLAFESYDQVHFTDAEIGLGNAVLRGFRRI